MSMQEMADDSDFDDLHWEIIKCLREGRATPGYLAEQTGESRQLVSNRLDDLVWAGIVEKPHRGLYELNPEEVPERDG